METKKVKLTVNGLGIEVVAGTSVFEAAAKVGIVIPHYCYHPDLSVAGVCRMCTVEIEKLPRLQISCNTPVAEGMVVRSDTEKVQDAVKNVLELHLINHPIDCPICDKAGECKLQDYYAKYGLYQSRMEYDKVHKPKAVDIGTIVLDEERCILCTRCVRFTAEVTKTNELGIFNRGDRSELRTFDGGPLHNDYTGNLADICPVGALTAKDFRFRQRVWFLERTDSVCGQCAHGCNTSLSVNPNTKKLFRVEPRRNPEVNKSWICDLGRWEFHYIHAEDRVQTPLKRIGGAMQEVTWHEVFGDLKAKVVAAPDRVFVGLSTHLTCEEMADAFATFGALGVKKFGRIVDENAVEDKQPFDSILKHRDLTPNAEGFVRVAKACGVSWLTTKEVSALGQQGMLDWIFLLGLEGHAMPGAALFLSSRKGKEKIVIHATNLSPLCEVAEYVVPNVSQYEKRGTFVNAQGRAQKVNPAVPGQFTARDAHAVVFGITRGNDRDVLPVAQAQKIFESVIAPKVFRQEKARFRKFEPLGILLEGVGR